MVVIDSSGAVVDDPDIAKGRIERREMRVVHSYVVDSEERGHWETVAEYPETGGRDVEWAVDEPERGHWETRDADTDEPVAFFDGSIPDDLTREEAHEDVFEYGAYIPYTGEELAGIERDRAASREASARMAQVGVAASAFARMAAPSLGDEQAAAMHLLFPDVKWGETYSKGEVVRHAGKVYRVAQDVEATEGHPPGAGTESLYTLIDVALDGIRVWHAPSHADNAWGKGERCHHPGEGGPVWRSLVDGNVWEPGAAGTDNVWIELE